MPNVAESNGMVRSVPAGKGSDAGDLSHILSAPLQLGSGSGRPVGKLEAHELAMNIAARVYALHNLLPYVAALLKIEGMLLLGFLRQIALADVLSIAWHSSSNACHFQSLKACGLCASLCQEPPNRRHILRRHPDLVVLALC